MKIVDQLSVMVVEDNEDYRHTLVQFLGIYGFNPVYDGADGQAAWEGLQEHEVDLLVTDINMPRMNGVELLRRVRERWPALPVIVITGYQHELHNLEPFHIQATLCKPFKMPALAAEIQRIFQAGV